MYTAFVKKDRPDSEISEVSSCACKRVYTCGIHVISRNEFARAGKTSLGCDLIARSVARK